jgi:hypothetical protein
MILLINHDGTQSYFLNFLPEDEPSTLGLSGL